MRFLLAILMLVTVFSVQAKTSPRLTPKQQTVLQQAVLIGTEYGVADLLPGLIFRESSLGRLTTDARGKHFGVGHVNLATAKSVARDNPELGTISAARLRNDTELGLRVAALYLRDCVNQFGSGQRALVCYNGGPRHAQRFTSTNYSRLVMKHNRELAGLAAQPVDYRLFAVVKETVDYVPTMPSLDPSWLADCWLLQPEYSKPFWRRSYVASYTSVPCATDLRYTAKA